MRLALLASLLPSLLQPSAKPAKVEPVYVPLAWEAGKLTSLPLPRGGVFTLSLTNRMPRARYRLQVTTAEGAPSVTEIAPVPSFALSGGSTPDCLAIDAQMKRVLEAPDEPETQKAWQALVVASGASTCPSSQIRVMALFQEVHYALAPTYQLKAGQAFKVTVSRLAADTSVARTWTFEVEPPKAPAPVAALSSWPHRTESEWLVSEVAQGVVEMLTAGPRPTLPGGTAPAVTAEPLASGAGAPGFKVSARVGARGDVVAQDVSVATHVWDPAAYAGWAQAVQKGLGATPMRAASASGSALEALLDPRPATLQRENQRISALLEKDPRSASAHEQAALLLGAFALREAAGDFADTRPALCRMTAHLAVAAALRGGGPASVDGADAVIVLDTLAGRQRAALAALDRESGRQGLRPAERAWILALRMRNGGDFRLLGAPRAASLLERREYFRARKQMQGGLKALDALKEFEAEPIADWGRIILEGSLSDDGRRALTVQEGGLFAGPAAQLEVTEIAAVLGLASEGAPARIAEILTQPRGGAAPQVIASATWAAAAERHLLHAAQAEAVHLGRRLSDGSALTRSREDSARTLGGLPLYPLLERSLAAQLSKEPRVPPVNPAAECEREVQLVRSGPQRVTAALWSMLEGSCIGARKAGLLVPAQTWFRPGLPFGTTYDAAWRVPAVLKKEAAATEAALALAPFDPSIIGHALAARGTPTAEQFKSAWGPLLDYNSEAMLAATRLAPEGSDARMEERIKLCQADADRCTSVGVALCNAGRADESAAALQRAFDAGRDRVRVSQNMDCLVDYHFDRGDVKRAEAIADAVAEVYSAGGLKTRARLSFRQGRLAEAEAWYKKLAERYPEMADEVKIFWVRAQRRYPDAPYKKVAPYVEKDLFAGRGIERVTVDDFRSGRVSVSPYFAAKQVAGPALAVPVLESDQVLAVDGIRVGNVLQFLTARGFTDDPEITLIVLRGSEPMELKGTARRSLFGPARPPAKGR